MQINHGFNHRLFSLQQYINQSIFDCCSKQFFFCVCIVLSFYNFSATFLLQHTYILTMYIQRNRCLGKILISKVKFKDDMPISRSQKLQLQGVTFAWLGAKVMRVLSIIFCYPFMQKIFQNQVSSRIISIVMIMKNDYFCKIF